MEATGQVEGVLALIYESALESGDWWKASRAIADFCGGANAALVQLDPTLGLAEVTTPRADPDIVEAYNQHWWAHDPTAKATGALAPGTITDLSTTGRERFLGSRFHREFWSRSGLGAERLASNLIVDGSAFSSVVLQTDPLHDEITVDMRERFSLIVPHLVRGMSASAGLRRMTLNLVGAGLDNAVPILIVDADARLEEANEAAIAMLRDGGEASLVGFQVVLRDAVANARVRHALRASGGTATLTGPGRIRFRSQLSGEVVAVEVMPMPPGIHGYPAARGSTVFALVFDDPAARARRTVATLRERYGLTPAEARLAVEIAKGDGRAAAAARCGISVNTARSHMKSIFAKTDVHRQAALVRLIDRIDQA